MILGLSGLLALAAQLDQVTLPIVADLQIVGNIHEPSGVLRWVQWWIFTTEMRFVQIPAPDTINSYHIQQFQVKLDKYKGHVCIIVNVASK